MIYEILNNFSIFLEDLFGPSHLHEDIDDFLLFISRKFASLEQKTISETINRKFSDPFELGMQELLHQILILNPDERPNAETIYRLYCAKFNLPVMTPSAKAESFSL